ncbi:MAG TPA: DbpA RNA binding domain-containing protein [Gemmatimonadaceae bacterium]|nr:DbpA RNA binding domain-containing protein [Gemmatimonadaceae bacterium]
MEQDDRELAGAARSAHVLHITPRIGGESDRLVHSTLGKLTNRADTGVALLVIVPERETAYELVSNSRSESTGGGDYFVPLTTPSRAARLLQRNPAAIVGTPADLLALVRATELKLQGVRQVVLLWPDSMLVNEAQSADLDTLLSELPRDADRTLIAEQATPTLESFIERFALKPRRLTHSVSVAIPPRQVGYVIVAAEQRAAALQRLLDTRDATDVAVVVDDEQSSREVAAALAALGEDAGAVLNPRDVTAASLIVWYGPPRGAVRVAELLAATAETSETVLLATPAELQRFRTLSPALTLNPASLPQPTDAAAQRVRALRDELSSLLRREPMDAELATIEPLLANHDAAEIAAAALRLLGRARQAIARAEQVDRTSAPAAARTAQPAAPAEQPWTRLFLSVGERDGVRRGDLVGAITGEASITGSQIGKITLHETYSLVEVASSVAEHVVERLTGVSIRGRRVMARPDRAAGARGTPGEARRGPRRDPSEVPQSARAGPRAAREHEEWSSRSERLRHSRRSPAEPPAPPEVPGSEP